MSTHTKGPWKFGNTTSDQKLILGDISERYVCSVQIWQTPRRMGLIDESEREANAQLISAAPELLEALKMYMGICGNTGYSTTREQFQMAYKQAEQAIAKAKDTSQKKVSE